MNEIAAGGGAFPALIVTLITVAMGGAVGWWLRKMITPQGQPDTPQELGRAWAGWVIFVSCATQLSAFIGELDAASFFYWLIGGGAMTAVAYAAGWGYGKWFKFSGPPMSPPHDLPSAPSAGMPDKSVAEENAYARAADELETNQVDKATWARAFSESDGDAEKSKARYITLRVKKLTQQTPALNSSPMFSGQSQHGGAQTSPVDLENNLSVLDDKDRLWKAAQEKATGQSADVSATSTSTPSNTAKANSATADRHAHGTAQASSNELTELYEAGIGEKNTSYYLTKFAQFDRQGPGLKASWNWAAFFLVPIWALYRKMYGLFFALWGASTVATFISKLNAPLLLNLAVLAAWAAFGIYANSLYHHHLKKKIAVARSTVRAPNVLVSLGNKGGVNLWVSWVGVGLLVVSILAGIVLPQQPPPTAIIPSQQTADPTVSRAERVGLMLRAELGGMEAQHRLGVIYAKGQGVPQDYAEAAKWYRKAAEQGHAKSQFNLGKRYLLGQGVSKDYAEALKWLRKAAEQENADAQNGLGIMYRNGLGTPQDYAEAVKWYRKAAEQGLAVAQSNIGEMYSLGLSVPRDYAEAVKWYRKAAEQGLAVAQTSLGFQYRVGLGVPQDDVQAAYWYHKAAEQGDPHGQTMLAGMYSNGGGVPQDDVEAAKWYHKAADQGSLPAQSMLGIMYQEGLGVPQDSVQAYMWFSLAAVRAEAIDAKLGKPSPEVNKMFEHFSTDRFLRDRQTVESVMTPAQIAQAQASTLDWLAKHQR